MNSIDEVREEVRKIKGCAFVGFDYETQSTGQISRFVLCLGVDYERITRANLRKALRFVPRDEVEAQARQEVIDSLLATLAGNNEGNKRAGTYEAAGNGMIQTDTGNFEAQGLLVSRKVLRPGIVKQVNSRPLTLAKERVKRGFACYTRLAIQPGRLHTVTISKKKINIQ